MTGHPLYPSLPKTKESSGRLRVPCSQLALSTGSNIKWQFNANIVFNFHDFLLSLIFKIVFGFEKCNFSSLACIFAEPRIKTKIRKHYKIV